MFNGFKKKIIKFNPQLDITINIKVMKIIYLIITSIEDDMEKLQLENIVPKI